MYTMTESVAVTKVAETQKDSLPARSDNSSHRAQNEPEMQLGSLRGVINVIRLDGGTPSVDSIAIQLSGMTSTGRASVLQALQQTHGNLYVQQVVLGVQAKLMVGQPNDRYEQEADRVADTVMKTSEPQVQRQLEEEEEKKEDEEEEELIQPKPLAEQITTLVERQPEGVVVQSKSEKSVTSSYPGRYVHRVAAWIQAKLKPGPPNDRYEQEADRVADTVMRISEPQVQRQLEEEEEKKEDEEFVQTKTIAEQNIPLVQRQVEEEEEEEEEELIQPKPFAEQITPLVQRQTEGVVVQSKSEKSVSFSYPGRYVHRVAAWIQAKLKPGPPNDRYEQEADRVADTVMRMSEPQVQRQLEEEEELVQTKTIADQNTPLVQRQVEEEEEEEEEELIQPKPLAEQITPLVQRQPEGVLVQFKSEKSVSFSYPGRYVHRVAAWIQAKLKPGPPSDRYEQEADRVADMVMRAHELKVQRQLEEEEDEELVQTKTIADQITPVVQRPVGALLQTRLLIQKTDKKSVRIKSTFDADLQSQLNSTKGAGEPLPEIVKSFMEAQFGRDFSDVRLHTGPTAVQMSQGLDAQAFTHGGDIYFNEGRYNPYTDSGRHLLAHELTHVVQQNAAPEINSNTERQVEQRSDSQSNMVQRSIWSDLIESGANFFWSRLEEIAPRNVVQIIRQISSQGIIGFLRERISGAITRIFDRLRGSDNEVIASLVETFRNLAAEAGAILEALASGDCGPLFAAANRLKETVSQLAGDAWNAITDFFSPVGEFFSDLWQSYGAPAIDWISDVAGDVWEFIQNLGGDIWKWLMPVREDLSSAWDWVKEQIGIGGGEGDSQGGLIGWVQEKAGQAWSAIREVLQPVIAPIQGVVERIRSILPLDAILNLRETVTDWLNNVTNMTASMDRENGVVEQQTSLREDILPAVLRTIHSLSASIISAGQWVSGQIGAIANTVQGFIGSLRGNPILGRVVNVIQWLPDRVTQLTQWAQTTVMNLFRFVGDGLVRLSTFIEPVLNTLQKVVEVISDLAGKLSELVFGQFWRMIPRCIRDPIKNFIVERILSNIPIFGQLSRIPNIWARVETVAMRILRQVFVNGDLLGAAWTFFREVLGLLNIPAQLVTGIISKAATALGDILRDPIGFLMNLVRGMVSGFQRFGSNIGRHLLSGISGWLFSQLQQAGIQPPADFSLRSILGFVLQILDITRERIFRRMERHPRIGRERVARLKRMVNVLTGMWQWVSVLIREGPAGLWRMLRERLSNLWETVLNSIITWISTRVISRALARLATMADPSGIGAVVNIILTIYQAIQTAAQYARQILEAVNRFLDGVNNIARGAIGPAANFLERALARLLPAAIGFIANWVGLGGLGRRIREMVERIRARVDRAIDWLIERGVRTIDAVLRGVRAVGGAIRRGAGRVLQWWRRRHTFTVRGERHALFFEGGRLIINTERRVLDDFLRGFQQLRRQTNTVEQGDEGRIAQLYGEAVGLKNQLERAKDQAASERRSQVPDFDATLERSYGLLASKVSALIMADLRDRSDNPPTNIAYPDPLIHEQLGRRAIADPLSIPGTSGSRPSGAPTRTHIWETISQRRTGGGPFWVLGHLINQELHGQGTVKENITPISRSANSLHQSQAESRVKDYVWNRERANRERANPEGNVAKYVVGALYGGSNRTIARGLVSQINTSPLYSSSEERAKAREILGEEEKLATTIACSSWRKNRGSGDEWTKEPESFVRENIPNRVPNELPRLASSPPRVSVNLSRRSHTAGRIEENTDLNRDEAQAICNLRNGDDFKGRETPADPDGRFTRYEQLSGVIGSDKIDILRNRSANVRLNSNE